MSVMFMGTDRFAVPALKAIINSGVELVCVITQPDQPKGRGLKVTPSPVKEVALEYRLPVYQPERVREKEFIAKVREEFKPDLIIVAAFGQILPKALLDLPAYGCINLHPSLLPKYRGAAPVQRAVMNGEKETGVTVMFMDEGEDTGDIIIQESVEIGISETADLLSQRLADLAARMLLKVLHREDMSAIPRHPQDHSKASRAPKLKKEDGLIDWGKTALEIHNLVRGTVPWPGAYTTFQALEKLEDAPVGENNQLKIRESRLIGSPSKAPAGTITDILLDSSMVVATGDMGLAIITVQPANKSRMKAKDFMNGYRIKVGDILGR